MFGYVVINKPELKLREYTEYQGYYCGLCHMLREKYGMTAGLTLTYDMTFLVMLLGALYEPKLEMKKRHCPIHPIKKKPMIRSEVTEYAADMNILLSHGHLRDDWEDEKKAIGLAGSVVFGRRARFVEEKYPRQAQVVVDSLQALNRMEKEYLYHWSQAQLTPDWQVKLGCEMHMDLSADIDEVSRPFGELMGELFVWREDAFAPILRRFGFFLGKYIYIRDALDDLEKDRKKGCFNPFLHCDMDEETEAQIRAILDVTRRSAIIEFEKLPLERDIAILRNILYEGVQMKINRKESR
ncbi:MAG: DUF5685 family protein [Eubacterium sp.]|nr:DUF5685 family protein [Eubacterium sp.]